MMTSLLTVENYSFQALIVALNDFVILVTTLSILDIFQGKKFCVRKKFRRPKNNLSWFLNELRRLSFKEEKIRVIKLRLFSILFEKNEWAWASNPFNPIATISFAHLRLRELKTTPVSHSKPNRHGTATFYDALKKTQAYSRRMKIGRLAK